MNRDTTPHNVSRRRLLQTGVTASLAGLAGCSFRDIIATPTPQSNQRQSESTSTPGTPGPDAFTILHATPVQGLDPLAVTDRPSQLVYSHVFEGLYEYEGGVTPTPRLAARPPAVDDRARRWTVELRTGTRFQNDEPVRARDVKYSYEAPVEEATDVRTELDDITRVTVVDERTVRFELERPRASFHHTLTHPIVPKAVRTGNENFFSQSAAIGSGPFELAEWSDGEVRLQPWEEYWRGSPPIQEELWFRTVSDPERRKESLNTGDSEIIEVNSDVTRQVVQNTSGLRLETEPRITYFYFGFNCKEGPTAERRVREAVDYTFSMDEAVSEAVQPRGIRQYSPVPIAVTKDWDLPRDAWKAIPHDPDLDEARRLFDDADVPRDYPWRIIVPPDDTRQRLAEAVATGLRESGFTDVTVSRLEWGAMLSRHTTGRESDYNLFAIGWTSIPDPDGFTYPLLARDPRTLGTTNGTFYGTNTDRGKRATQKIVQARETSSRDERRRLYADAVTTALEDRAHLPAYTLRNTFGFREEVEEMSVTSTDNQLHFPRS